MMQFYVKQLPFATLGIHIRQPLYLRRGNWLSKGSAVNAKSYDDAILVKNWMRFTLILLIAVGLQLIGAPNAAALDLPGSTPVGPSSPLPNDQPLQCDNNPSSCPVGGFDVGSSSGGPHPSSNVGNPIDLMSGNKFQSETDFSLPNSQLMFRRMYNSSSTDSDLGLGMGWRHSYAVSIVDSGDGNREIVQSDGTRLRFSPNGTNAAGNTVLHAVQGLRGYVVQDENRHQWHLSDGRIFSFIGTFLVKIDWPDQRSLQLYYRSKKLESVTDETGRVMVFSYTPWPESGLNTYTESRFANVPGHLEKVTLPDGSIIHYDFDTKVNLSKVRFPDGSSREYHYENEVYPNNLTGLTDRLGIRFASWTYDEQGRANSSEHANGVENVMLQYPDLLAVNNGEVVETIVTNSLGEQGIYSWRQGGAHEPPKMLSSTGVQCATCPPTGIAYEYDEQGRLIAGVQTDSGSASTTGDKQYEYDALGRLTRTTQMIVDDYGDRIQRVLLEQSYKGTTSQPILIKSPSVNANAQRATETTFDDNDRPVLIVERGYTPVFNMGGELGLADIADQAKFEAIERRTTLKWEENRLVAVDGPRSDVDDTVYFEWDTLNRLVGVSTPASPALRVTKFDAMGRAVHFQFGNRSPIELTYNLANKVIKSKQGSNVLEFIYDAENRLTVLSDSDGHTKTIQHDEAGRVKSITDEVGRVSSISRDTESRVIGRSLLGIDGSTIRLVDYLFDEKGGLLRSTDQRMGGSSPSTQVLEFDSESIDNGMHVSDANTGAGISSVVDVVSRMTIMTGIDGARTQIGFDHKGGIVSVLDAHGNLNLSPTDDFGRTVMTDSADTGRVINRFDEAGNRTAQQLANGVLVKYQYDAANRRILRDANGKMTTWLWNESNGQMVEATNQDTVELFEYDKEARLTGHIRKIDTHQFRTSYAYDERGRLIKKTLPNDQQLAFHYHDDGINKGKLRAITRNGIISLFDNTIATDIDLERRDGRASYLSGNGIRTSETIAPNGELSSLEISGSLAFNYSFDAVGRIARIERNDAQGEHNTTYSYNNGRLSRASNNTWGTQSWQYDELGNRLSQETKRAGGYLERKVYRYPTNGEGNRLLGVENTLVQDSGRSLSGRIEYRYGASGAPEAVGNLTYTYNNWQRPISVSKDGVLLAEYTYNAFGERVKKVLYQDDTNAPEASYYLYDGSTLTAEANASGDITRQYVYLEGHKPIAMLAGNETYAIHTDHIGAPRQMSNAKGEIVWRADYTAFGKATLHESNSASLNLRLPGQYADEETGTYYNYFRDYDPESGRYRTSDPMGQIAGLNTYAYANGLPQNLIDPLGLAAAVPVLAGSAFYAWVSSAATVATISNPVGWLVGGTVALGVAAYWYANHNTGGEQGFLEQTDNVKPSREDYFSIRFEIAQLDESLDPGFGFDDTWGSLFAARNLLLQAQQNYVDRMDALMDLHGEGCLDAIEQGKYNQATADLAEAAVLTASTQEDGDSVSIPGTWSGLGNGPEDDPECTAMAARVQAAKRVLRTLGQCQIVDPASLLEVKRLAWLEAATARSINNQRCYSGGDPTHQDEAAIAWKHTGQCTRYLAGDFRRF